MTAGELEAVGTIAIMAAVAFACVLAALLDPLLARLRRRRQSFAPPRALEGCECEDCAAHLAARPFDQRHIVLRESSRG